MRIGTIIAAAIGVIGGGAAGITNYLESGPTSTGAIGGACITALGLAFGIWGALRPGQDMSGVEAKVDQAINTGREGQRAARGEGAATRVAMREESADIQDAVERMGHDVVEQLTAAFEARGAGPATIEIALEKMAEVLQSNDPDKDAAKAAIRAGDLEAAEAALADIYQKEEEAIALMTDRVEQAKAAAAETAMEKAALAATRSAAEALDWYQKAAHMAPSDFWAQIMICRTHAIIGNLAAALEAAKVAFSIARDDTGPEGVRNKSVAHDEIGNVLVKQGKLPDALQRYEDSREIFERLAKADPGNAGWQRDLSVSLDKVADVLVKQGKLPDALQRYEDSREIFERLAK
ncbi:MAG: tetratricopeptide repeat protein, partial [Pseudomonadota bacterium]